jgi:CheY-like chemotaxis protein
MTSRKPLVLIVDDDFDFIEINRHILEAAGYRVTSAAEPAEALARMAPEPPDLIITDLMMTTIDAGFSFSRAIKEDPRFAAIPIIISTSVSSALGLDFRPQTADDLAKMHIDAYFDKPLPADALLAKVKELLGGAGGEQE